MSDVWKTSKNGKTYAYLIDLPEGGHIRSQLGSEDGDRVIIDNFMYVLKIYDGRTLVFRNPIGSSDGGPNHQSRRSSDRNEPHQVILSLQHIQWLEQAAMYSGLVLESVRRIEKLLTDFASSGPEQNNQP